MVFYGCDCCSTQLLKEPHICIVMILCTEDFRSRHWEKRVEVTKTRKRHKQWWVHGLLRCRNHFYRFLEFCGHPSNPKRYSNYPQSWDMALQTRGLSLIQGPMDHWCNTALDLSKAYFQFDLFHLQMVDVHSWLARNLCSMPPIRCKMIVVSLIDRHRPFVVQGPCRENDSPLVPWCPVGVSWDGTTARGVEICWQAWEYFSCMTLKLTGLCLVMCHGGRKAECKLRMIVHVLKYIHAHETPRSMKTYGMFRSK